MLAQWAFRTYYCLQHELLKINITDIYVLLMQNHAFYEMFKFKIFIKFYLSGVKKNLLALANTYSYQNSLYIPLFDYIFSILKNAELYEI